MEKTKEEILREILNEMETVSMSKARYDELIAMSKGPKIDDNDSAIICCALTATLKYLTPEAGKDITKIILENGSENLKQSFVRTTDLHLDLLNHFDMMIKRATIKALEDGEKRK